jgi:hemolysin III
VPRTDDPVTVTGDPVKVELPLARPRMRGWIHSAAAPAAAAAAVLLWNAASPGLPRISVAVFGVGLVALYLVSGVYHLPPWPEHVRRWLGRADVAVIQLFIAASFTPFAVHTLGGAWRTWSLGLAWAIAIIGACVAASPAKAPRWLSFAAYASFGSLAAIPLLRVADVLSTGGTALVVAGGLLYLVGGAIYARQAPNPWPSWFGFHEVFHLLVVIASTLHAIALWRYALPLA